MIAIIKNEKGVTLIELMVSIVILSIIILSTYQFFESYKFQASELGEYETGKFLLLNGMESERVAIIQGDQKTGVINKNSSILNKTRFETSINKELVSTEYGYFNQEVPMYKLTGTVTWKNRKLEVTSYVSSRE